MDSIPPPETHKSCSNLQVSFNDVKITVEIKAEYHNNLEIPILLRWYLYFETTPCVFAENIASRNFANGLPFVFYSDSEDSIQSLS